MRRQRAVQLVELFAVGGGDGDGDAQVVAAFAFAQFDGGGVKAGVKLVRDEGDGVDEAVDPGTHDLDRKQAGVDDERFFDHGERGGRGVWGGRFGGIHDKNSC